MDEQTGESEEVMGEGMGELDMESGETGTRRIRPVSILPVLNKNVIFSAAFTDI